MASLKRTATSLRALALSSWHAAQREVDANGAMLFAPATFVGYALEIAEGDVDLARNFVPDAPATFARQVHEELDRIAIEEGLAPRKVAAIS